MPQRRFHSKSRQGCVQCKKNRTKCDEKKPKCGRCRRADLNCSLADPNSNLIFIPGETKPSKEDRASDTICNDATGLTVRDILTSSRYLESMTSSPYSASSSSGSSFIDDERERLKLLSHYILRASASIAEVTIAEDQDQSLWSVWVTDLALDSDFLLHGVLSLSALHLALCGISPQHNTILAIHHHDQGVELYRPHLTDITNGNYYAMIAFSCIIAFYALGIQHLSETEKDPITKLEQFLTLVRASSVIIKADYAVVLQSPWASTMTHVSTKPLQELPNEIKEMLYTIRNRVSSKQPIIDEDAIYDTAISALQDNLEFAFTYLFTQKTITTFVLMCPSQFWDMVSARDSLALVILANYAVILHWHRSSVWFNGWGKDVVNAVYDTVPVEWHDCIAWARRETELF